MNNIDKINRYILESSVDIQRESNINEAIKSLMSYANKDQKITHSKHIDKLYKDALDQLNLLRTNLSAKARISKNINK